MVRMDVPKLPHMLRDLNTPPPQIVQIPGPAGLIAGTFEMPDLTSLPDNRPKGAMLLLHPHPQHGGTRKNNVVRHAALGALEAGWAALRIDFRGAGDSEGVYDEGEGEMADAAAALDWLKSELANLPTAICGYSFGCRVGLRFLMRNPSAASRFLGIAYPTNFYEWPKDTDGAWPAKSAFLLGEKDELADIRAMDAPRRNGAAITLLPTADHFFLNELADVRGWAKSGLEIKL